ncbi:hypothetical protein WS90_10790 [Burkholderia cepacia]|uniref:Uncharacterized protein n=1 Tax=Burkholderia cepacia TaxID=292 RepID=A0A124SPM3_BURCE|nr:hypothetical protein WS90_10790 [Burkholderia cepacia]
MIRELHDAGEMTIRIAYNLFTQKPNAEKEDFVNWTKSTKYHDGTDYFRNNGAGEMLVFSAAHFMALNSFFEHLGLIAALVLVTMIGDVRSGEGDGRD